MGKKVGWFCTLIKARSPESEAKKNRDSHKSKRRWFMKHSKRDLISIERTELPAFPVPFEETKFTEAENGQSKHAYSVALATAVAAEAAVAAAHAAAVVVRLTAFSGKSKEEVAVIKIQAAFRGYLARRALRSLRGLVRLKSLTQGQFVRRQATTTLRCLQTLARVQSQIHARRIRMSEENQAFQRQLQQRHAKDLENLKSHAGENWVDSMQSKEQIEAKLLNRRDAAVRRERALAYAFTHQQTWKNIAKSGNPTFINPINPHWGWSWLERWSTARLWDHELYNDSASPKSTTAHATSLTITGPISSQSPCTPPSNRHSKLKQSCLGADPRTVRSGHYRRHSVSESSRRDDETFPGYMAPTESVRAKSRLGLGAGTPEKGPSSFGSAKKKLSFSPGVPRRFSGPPKVESGSIGSTT